MQRNGIVKQAAVMRCYLCGASDVEIKRLASGVPICATCDAREVPKPPLITVTIPSYESINIFFELAHWCEQWKPQGWDHCLLGGKVIPGSYAASEAHAHLLAPPPTSDYQFRYTDRGDEVGCIKCGEVKPLRFVALLMICQACLPPLPQVGGGGMLILKP